MRGKEKASASNRRAPLSISKGHYSHFIIKTIARKKMVQLLSGFRKRNMMELLVTEEVCLK